MAGKQHSPAQASKGGQYEKYLKSYPSENLIPDDSIAPDAPDSERNLDTHTGIPVSAKSSNISNI